MLRLLFRIEKIPSKNISPFGTVKTESERTFRSVDDYFLKSDRTNNTSKMLRYLFIGVNLLQQYHIRKY